MYKKVIPIITFFSLILHECIFLIPLQRHDSYIIAKSRKKNVKCDREIQGKRILNLRQKRRLIMDQ